MDLKIVLFLIVIVLIASFLQSGIGFGFPIVAMAFLPMVFPYSRAAGIQQCIAIASTLFLSIKYRKKLRMDVLTPIMIPTALIGAAITVVSVKIDSDIMFMLLGGMLIILSIYFICFNGKIHAKASVKNGLRLGVLCGVTNGLFTISGPPAAVYFLEVLDDKLEYMAAMQLFFTVCNVIGLIVRIAMGSLVLSDFSYISIGWLAMLAGTFLGGRFLSKIPAKNFKMLVYTFIGINGLWIILSHI